MKGRKPVIGDVERSELEGLLALFKLPVRALLTFVLTTLMFG